MKLYQLYDRKNKKFLSNGSWSSYNNNLFGNGGKVWSSLSSVKKFITYKKNNGWYEDLDPTRNVILEYEINPIINRIIDIDTFKTHLPQSI